MNSLAQPAAEGDDAVMDIGALFNWDGVIIDSSAHHEASWERLAAEERRDLPPDHFKKGFGMKNEVIKAAQRAGRPPERCVVFEDALMGVESGLAAGARVVAVATTNTPEVLATSGAHRIVRRLDELDLDVLRSLFTV